MKTGTQEVCLGDEGLWGYTSRNYDCRVYRQGFIPIGIITAESTDIGIMLGAAVHGTTFIGGVFQG